MRALSGVVFVFAAAAPLFAQGDMAQGQQDPTPLYPAADLSALMTDWRAQHGENWRLQADGQTGHLEFIWGGRTEDPRTLRTDLEFVELARQRLAETSAMHGVALEQLELDRALHLPLGFAGTTDKLTVRFRQIVNGIPVEGGFVNVLSDMQGRLLSVHSTALPHVSPLFVTSASMSPERAAERAAETFAREQGLKANDVGAPQLIVDSFFDGNQRVPRLAWKIEVFARLDEGEPRGATMYVDARNATVYRQTPNVHHFDVSGTVTSLATPGLLPDTGTNPETAQAMRFMRVQAGAQTVVTDTNGNFTLVGVNAPVSATFTYIGTYNNVFNSAGAEYSLTTSLTQPTGNTVLMNPAPTEATTAQANVFRVTNLMRDFIRTINPSDATGDFVATANVMVNGQCNAYFDGSSHNYFPSGGGCNNSAFSTIISHEHGHWMNVRYGTGNGSDGMGEGNADVFAMYIFDSPIVGQSFSGGSIRTGTNNRQFCGDATPACYGQVHTDGEVWMGAAWKIRSRLNTTNGNAQGDLIANSIFLAWMNSYNQTQIRSVIESQWLTLDDNDGNINNGTPHFTDIDNGFRDQGFPGIVLLATSIVGVTDLPDTTDQLGPYTVTATITANQFPPLTQAQLRYRVDGGSFISLNMSPIGGNVYSAQIPGQISPRRVEYYISATDSGSNTAVSPSGAPSNTYDFEVGQVNIVGSWTFDGAANDQGWTHASIGDTSNNHDDWQRGTPEGRSGSGWADPSNAFSPGVCWGTDLGGSGFNGQYQANVHNYLRSPVLDCSGATNVKLRYKRWLTVQGSASDQARVLVNGTQVWINPTTTLSDTNWVSQEIDISSIADGNASVQIEFRLRTNGTTQLGGWNLDDIEVRWLGALPVPCPAPQSYCVSTPNSVGGGAFMGWQGSSNLSVNSLELLTIGLPPNQNGIYYYGQSITQVPFGNGVRCVGGTVFRMSVNQANAFGDVNRVLDLPNLPGSIQPGSTWNFQFWYRDPAAGGAGFNLSDGLRVQFCP